MNINTAQFLQASAEQKDSMMIDGLAFLAKQMEELERNARVLTGWISTYPDHVKLGYARLENPIDLIRTINEMNRRMDEMTAQLVNVDLEKGKLLHFIKKHITKKQLQS